MKAVLLLLITVILLGGASVYAGGRIISYNMNNNYKERADELAGTIAAIIDAEAVAGMRDEILRIYHRSQDKTGLEERGSAAFDAYVSQFSYLEENEDFIRLRNQLRIIQDHNSIDRAYILYLDTVYKAGIFMVDSAEKDAYPIGSFIKIDDSHSNVLRDPRWGFPAFISETEETGRLITAGVPIYLEGGHRVIGYAMVDISINEIESIIRRQILMIAGLAAFLSLIILVVTITLLERMVISPINRMSEAAASYYDKDREGKEGSLVRTVFAELDIRTGDEIEHLSESMKQMERDINDNISNIVFMTNELSIKKLEATQMNRLARTDALTHVRNRLAYEEEVRKLKKSVDDGLAEFGIAAFDLNDLKGINDSFGHDKGNIYICANCQAICETFKHSPVFRIGGDEFAAIIQGRDYVNITELLSEFEERNRSDIGNPEKDPWERISTACGYAEYDKARDKDVDAVFKRADEEMYGKKIEMKKR